MRYVFVILAALCLVFCKPGLPDDGPFVVYPPYDGGFVDAEVDVLADCRVACENLARLACPESAPAGRTCGSVCTIASQTGYEPRTACLATAGTPDDVRACCKRGERCTRFSCTGR